MKFATTFLTTAIGSRIERSIEHAAVHAIGKVDSAHARISQCKNENDQISMKAHLDMDEFDEAPAGWEQEGTEYVYTFNQDELKKSVDSKSNELVMFTTLDVQVGVEKNFFKQDKHQLAFKCRFSLDSQMVSQDLAITADDTVYDTTGVDSSSGGSLGYVLHFDHERFKLGERVNFSVTPKNPNLIYARVTHCEVSNGSENYTVFGTDEYPYCADKFTDFLPPTFPYVGTMNGQSFSFLAFKWHDTSSSIDEMQRVACNIEVSATPFTPHQVKTCDGEELVTQPTVITQAPPTNPPDTTAEVEITMAQPSTPEAICNKQCQKIQAKINLLKEKLDLLLGLTGPK